MPAKKNDDERARYNYPGYTEPSRRKDKEELPEWDGVVRGPELPDGRPWHQATQKWWHTWRCSPQAMVCTETDWESMKVAAIIHDRIARGVNDTALANLTGELRKREGMFGASFEDRKRLGMKINSDQSRANEEQVMNREVERTIDYFNKLNRKYSGGK